MADDLARWAVQRAPDLLARAEAQAVATLRDALLRAALGEPAAAAEPAPARTAPEPGELLWSYCVLRAREPAPHDLHGVASGAVERVEAGDLVALVGRVPASEFAAEPLRRNLNDLPWLERVARAHEAVLEQALWLATIVPLPICTLYEGEDGVRRMLEREQETLAHALELLAGRQEWGVQLLVDPHKLADEARAGSQRTTDLEDELATRSEGGAYMLRRRLERHVREAADALAAGVAGQVHARFQDWAVDAVKLSAQNRDLSGQEGEMLLNGAYLVETDRVEGLRALAGELQERHQGIGARIELTGPWPPYNFVPRAGTAAIA